MLKLVYKAKQVTGMHQLLIFDITIAAVHTDGQHLAFTGSGAARSEGKKAAAYLVYHLIFLRSKIFSILI